MLVVGPGGKDETSTPPSLPFGAFRPRIHRTLEISLRTWVEEQTNLDLGYVEQLYTFGDRGREGGGEAHIISIGYLALTQEPTDAPSADRRWRDWYRFFPWEDQRGEQASSLRDGIEASLRGWAAAADTGAARRSRLERVRYCFGFDGVAWAEENVLERYELLYEAGLVGEAARDRGVEVDDPLGETMSSDHRRILATGMGRLRGKLKYRPVVFELMPPTFTLLTLQRAVEAISGVLLHKQNFRRLVDREGLVEGTGVFSDKTGGRPAEEFRFRRDVMTERPASGLRYGSGRR